jgi:hypothetical protein
LTSPPQRTVNNVSGKYSLGHLARHLCRVDRRWRLAQAERQKLAERLVADKVKAVDVAEMAGVSSRTVAGLRAAGLGLAQATPQPMEPCGLKIGEVGTGVRGRRFGKNR